MFVRSFDDLVATSILIVGAPRSGTTWLAKILDSHPDVLYRHEPDEAVPAGYSIRDSVTRWVAQSDVRTAAKRPFFRKSWQSAPGFLLNSGLAYVDLALARTGLPTLPAPPPKPTARMRAVIKSIRLSDRIGAFAQEFPAGRILLMLRHPCGQVDSVMRGTRGRRFDLAEAGTDMPFDEASTIEFAASHGMDEPEFQRLSDAGKYAWSWRAFNETAFDAVGGCENVCVVVHSDLVAHPMAETRRFLDFVGLPWQVQTEAFLTRSTQHIGPTGYYGVLRVFRRGGAELADDNGAGGQGCRPRRGARFSVGPVLAGRFPE